MKALWNRTLWDPKNAAVARAGNRIRHITQSKEVATIDPFRLNELELPPQVRSDKREYQSPIGAVVLQNAFRERWTICRSSSNHAMQPNDPRN